jgi:hypothetical protein
MATQRNIAFVSHFVVLQNEKHQSKKTLISIGAWQ